MGNKLIRLVLVLAANALGLLIAALVLDKMSLDIGGFFIAVVIFTVLAAIFQPLVTKITKSKLPALEGASALIGTFLALVVTRLLSSDRLSISGAGTWVLATVIIFVVTFIAGIILPKLFISDDTTVSR